MGSAASALDAARYNEAHLKERCGSMFDEAKYSDFRDEEGSVSAEQIHVVEQAMEAADAPATDAATDAASNPGASTAEGERNAAAVNAPASGSPLSTNAGAADAEAADARAARAALPAGLSETIARFKRDTTIPKLHTVAQKKYDIFCRNRTAELYETFFALVGDTPLDWSEATFVREFKACVPFPGKTNERPVCGMAKGSTPHGLIRYEFKQCSIEECRVNGKEHGLRVVCTQMGDYWLRLFSHGTRIAQIVLSADCSKEAGPAHDGGGLKLLRSHVHLVIECLTNAPR